MEETMRREVFEETGITNLEGLRNIGVEFQTYFYAPWREVNYYAHTNVWMAETNQTEF
jgi:8-oxo-dGTP pyrophosphatase MutT (NUDIX family)